MSKIKLAKHQIEDSTSSFERQTQMHVRILVGLCLYTVVEIIIGTYMLIDFDGYGKTLLSNT